MKTEELETINGKQDISKNGFFISFDETPLFYRVWEPNLNTKEVVIILHRGHEHSGRIGHLVKELKLENKWCFSFDLRGHGLSPGLRGWAPHFNAWVKDLNSFTKFIQKEYNLPMENCVVIANSVGSVMAVQWVHDYAPRIKGLILAAPAFKIRLYVPFALTLLRLVWLFTDKLFVNSYVKSKMLTRDPQQAKSYDQDPLITKRIAISVLVSLFDSAKRLIESSKAIEIPTLILSAGSDFVVNNTAQKKFFNNISSQTKEFITLPHFKHAIFHELEREKALRPSRVFIEKCFNSNSSNLPMIVPEARAFTVESFNNLVKSPAIYKNIFYMLLRKCLVLFGPLSEGMRIGLTHGFDSGVSLDYVYLNKPQGRFFVGKMIDYFYLQSVGWRGIRFRKNNLKKVLKKTISDLSLKGEKPIILDCASGCARYIFESIDELQIPTELHLRDISQNNLDIAKNIAKEFDFRSVSFSCLDSFDLNNYSTHSIKPNIVIVSGLFELFSDNQIINNVVLGIKSMIQSGGYVLYTGQPWHPQLELIGRVLNNHKGHRWVMRTRIQAELDEIIAQSGFKKIETVVDELGIFTVSIAQST